MLDQTENELEIRSIFEDFKMLVSLEYLEFDYLC